MPTTLVSVLPLASVLPARSKEVASKDHLDNVKRNVMVVSELIEILSGEQKYLQRKLDRHTKTVVRGEGQDRAGKAHVQIKQTKMPGKNIPVDNQHCDIMKMSLFGALQPCNACWLSGN